MIICRLYVIGVIMSFFIFKQKTAYEMRISDCSSDVCSSDPVDALHAGIGIGAGDRVFPHEAVTAEQLQAAVEHLALQVAAPVFRHRSEERRVGKEGVSQCRSRW